MPLLFFFESASRWILSIGMLLWRRFLTLEVLIFHPAEIKGWVGLSMADYIPRQYHERSPIQY